MTTSAKHFTFRRYVGPAAAVALPLLLAGPAWPSANPACPLNTLNCDGVVTTTRDSAASCWSPTATGRYDLIQGWVEAGASAGCGGDCTSGSISIASDHYRVEGVVPGVPLTFDAQLAYTLSVGGRCHYRLHSSIVSVSIQEGITAPVSAQLISPYTEDGGWLCSWSASSSQTLRQSITRIAGEPFTIEIRANVAADPYASARGQLRFNGLPPGATVISCQGFRQDFPTGTKQPTWGRLKTLYR